MPGTTSSVLYPWAAAGKPIIACEPSCILTIKDDYPALLRGELRRQAEVVAAACLTFEELPGVAAGRQPATAAAFGRGRRRSWSRATAISARWSAWGRCCACCGAFPGPR